MLTNLLCFAMFTSMIYIGLDVFVECGTRYTHSYLHRATGFFIFMVGQLGFLIELAHLAKYING